MKRFIIMLAFTGCTLSISACNTGGDGTLESCATSLVGTFEGDKTGPITAQLMFDGTLSAIFVPDGEDSTREAEATVGVDTGELTPVTTTLQITGTMNFDTCEGSGEWTLFGADTGTWHIGLRDHAIF